MQNNEPQKNPRVVVVQKLYSYYLNKETEILFPKHRYKKFIKDIVNGTIERDETLDILINNDFKEDINQNVTSFMIKLIFKAALYEFIYIHKNPIKVIITEYLKVADFFVEESQKKYLNAILDKMSKIRKNDDK